MPEGVPKRKETEDTVKELEAALNPAKNYPRKRVAVACEVCRLRKTRCDAKRPCGFCTESGIEFVYRQPSQPEKYILLRLFIDSLVQCTTNQALYLLTYIDIILRRKYFFE